MSVVVRAMEGPIARTTTLIAFQPPQERENPALTAMKEISYTFISKVGWLAN
ncbi:MAG: hypothetical protein JOZ18_08230 [Chloroflexi bacterium]|nr:hypothetical protein [Chloroflexota bacterium]